jgi:PhoPQ-activated pathogenicity-related protein
MAQKITEQKSAHQRYGTAHVAGNTQHHYQYESNLNQGAFVVVFNFWLHGVSIFSATNFRRFPQKFLSQIVMHYSIGL